MTDLSLKQTTRFSFSTCPSHPKLGNLQQWRLRLLKQTVKMGSLGLDAIRQRTSFYGNWRLRYLTIQSNHVSFPIAGTLMPFSSNLKNPITKWNPGSLGQDHYLYQSWKLPCALLSHLQITGRSNNDEFCFAFKANNFTICSIISIAHRIAELSLFPASQWDELFGLVSTVYRFRFS